MAYEAYLSGEILPGTLYRIIRRVGEEGAGPVYEVEDSTAGKRYALKIIGDPKADVRELSDRLMRESRMLAQIADPRVVGVYTGGVSTDGHCFYVMEIPEGEPLGAALRRRGKLDIGSIFPMAIELSEALANIHAVGVVHRDVKPENIFIPVAPHGRGPTKLLLDLGVATPFESTPPPIEHGTYGYASPEQLRREPASPLMDIWSLGCVLFEAVTGRLPFEVSSDWRTFVDGVLGPWPAPRLSLAAPDAPADLVALVARMLRKEASRRLPRVDVVAETLRRIEYRLSVRPPPVAPVDPSSIAPEVGRAGVDADAGPAAPASGAALPPATTPDMAAVARPRPPTDTEETLPRATARTFSGTPRESEDTLPRGAVAPMPTTPDLPREQEETLPRATAQTIVNLSPPAIDSEQTLRGTSIEEISDDTGSALGSAQPVRPMPLLPHLGQPSLDADQTVTRTMVQMFASRAAAPALTESIARAIPPQASPSAIAAPSGGEESVTQTIPQATPGTIGVRSSGDESVTRTMPQASPDAFAAFSARDESVTRTMLTTASTTEPAGADESNTRPLPQTLGATTASAGDESVTRPFPHLTATGQDAPSDSDESVTRTMAQLLFGGGPPAAPERREAVGRAEAPEIVDDAPGITNTAPAAASRAVVATGTLVESGGPMAASGAVVENIAPVTATSAFVEKPTATSGAVVESSAPMAASSAIATGTAPPVPRDLDEAALRALAQAIPRAANPAAQPQPSRQSSGPQAETSLSLMPPHRTRTVPANIPNVVVDDQPSAARLATTVPPKPRTDGPSIERIPPLSSPRAPRRISEPVASDPSSHRALRRTYTLLFLSVLVAWMTVALVFLRFTRSRRRARSE